MTRTHRLWVVLSLNLVLVAGLVAVGFGAHSLGVLAEGVDYLADAAAIAVSLFAIRLDSRRQTGGRAAATWAAGVNAGWLLLLNLLVIAASADRLSGHVPEVHGLPVLISSAVAAAVMLAGAALLTRDEDPDLNLRAVVLDTVGDAAAAGGVAIAGGIILVVHGAYWLDPAVAITIAVVVGARAAQLLREVALAIRRPPELSASDGT